MTTAIKINQNDGKTRNVMTGGESTGDFDFPIYADTHLDVYKTATDGTITLLVKDTGYTVPSGSVNQQAGGTINLTSNALAGEVYTIYQAAPQARTTDFNQAGDFFADVLNQELDLITQQIQQIVRDLYRAPLAPVDTTLSSLSLPDPVDGKALIWNGVLGVLENGPDAGEISSAEANATAAAVSASNASDSEDSAAASAVLAQASVGGVRISSNDTDAGDLETKLLVSGGLTLSTQNDGGDETRTITLPDQAITSEKLADGVGFTTGDAKLTFKSSADTGWIMADDGTIGSAASTATNRAAADTEDLYTLLWNSVSDTYAPVSGGRGASAAADFAADKPLALTKKLGHALGIAGTGSGLSARALGETVGAETHTLIESEMPAHTHNLDRRAAPSGNAHTTLSRIPGMDSGGHSDSTSDTAVNSSGGDGAHNNMQPTTFLNLMIKL